MRSNFVLAIDEIQSQEEGVSVHAPTLFHDVSAFALTLFLNCNLAHNRIDEFRVSRRVYLFSLSHCTLRRYQG